MYRKDKKSEFYTRKAHLQGYAARSAYKLEEIDKKHQIFKKGDRVLDLGAAPGSWMQYIASKIGDKGFVQGIDIQDLKIRLTAQMFFLKRDLLKLDPDDLQKVRGKYDVVVSDAAPSTSGVSFLDAGRSLELTSKALDIARLALKPRGNFVTKLFDGESTGDLCKEIQRSFRIVKQYRPKAVTKQSRELYIIAMEKI